MVQAFCEDRRRLVPLYIVGELDWESARVVGQHILTHIHGLSGVSGHGDLDDVVAIVVHLKVVVSEEVVSEICGVGVQDLFCLADEAIHGQIIVVHLDVVVLCHRLHSARVGILLQHICSIRDMYMEEDAPIGCMQELQRDKCIQKTLHRLALYILVVATGVIRCTIAPVKDTLCMFVIGALRLSAQCCISAQRKQYPHKYA